MRPDEWAGVLLWWSCQSPVALFAAFWIIWIVSTEECSSLTQNLMQICCYTRSVILNVTATQYSYSLNSINCPHWLVQWSHHCSHMCIPVHSPWLPGYINVTQTILVILTMAALFLYRPCILFFFKWTKDSLFNKSINGVGKTEQTHAEKWN